MKGINIKFLFENDCELSEMVLSIRNYYRHPRSTIFNIRAEIGGLDRDIKWRLP